MFNKLETKVTIKTRRKCQKCRYVRCRLAGMDPDAVLTVDQKKVSREQLAISYRYALGDLSDLGTLGKSLKMYFRRSS